MLKNKYMYITVILLIISFSLGLLFILKHMRRTEPTQANNIQSNSIALPDSGNAPTSLDKPDVLSTKKTKENYCTSEKSVKESFKELQDEKLPLNEDRYLPFETLSKKDISATFAPHYTKSVSKNLTKEMQKDLELIMFHRLRWILEGDLESFRWKTAKLYEFIEKPFDPNSITQKHAQDAYEKCPYAPYFRLGFADTPFKVELTNVDIPNPSGNPLIKKLNEKAGKEKILVTVFVAARITPLPHQVDPYVKIEVILSYDRESSTFHFVRMNYKPTEYPAIDIPLFFQGIE